MRRKLIAGRYNGAEEGITRATSGSTALQQREVDLPRGLKEAPGPYPSIQPGEACFPP